MWVMRVKRVMVLAHFWGMEAVSGRRVAASRVGRSAIGALVCVGQPSQWVAAWCMAQADCIGRTQCGKQLSNRCAWSALSTSLLAVALHHSEERMTLTSRFLATVGTSHMMLHVAPCC